jgi:Holliday junction resolvase
MINSRNKGASVEREFIGLAYEYGGLRLRRNLEQCRSGGHDIDGLPGWAVEVKGRALTPVSSDIWAMITQARVQAQRVGARPVLALKVNRRGWFCYVDAADLWPDWYSPGASWVVFGIDDFFILVKMLGAAV